MVANIRKRYQTEAMEVCLSFNFAVVFILMYFRIRQRQVKKNVLMNRQNAATIGA